jgi:hypothetical protein
MRRSLSAAKPKLGPDATVVRRLRPDFSKPTPTPVQDP